MENGNGYFERLIDLYAAVDREMIEGGFVCDGCAHCCTTRGNRGRWGVFWRRRHGLEVDLVKSFLSRRREGWPKGESGDCPFLAVVGCGIYEVRPLRCRVAACSPDGIRVALRWQAMLDAFCAEYARFKGLSAAA
ncbi:MAG: YkgJ family cysteine cluster protein [Deltaproteobacteria bacterium]|nr:YkgJ family cysteine cluster protein [Deltaproteobacteria bacterium]